MKTFVSTSGRVINDGFIVTLTMKEGKETGNRLQILRKDGAVMAAFLEALRSREDAARAVAYVVKQVDGYRPRRDAHEHALVVLEKHFPVVDRSLAGEVYRVMTEVFEFVEENYGDLLAEDPDWDATTHLSIEVEDIYYQDTTGAMFNVELVDA